MGQPKRPRRSNQSSDPSIQIKQALVKAMRRAWMIHDPNRKLIIQATRRSRTRLKKDGTPAAKDQITFICEICGEEKPQTERDIDHIQAIGEQPGWPPGTGRSWDSWLAALFCDLTNLRALCKPCHKLKTKEEKR